MLWSTSVESFVEFVWPKDLNSLIRDIDQNHVLTFPLPVRPAQTRTVSTFKKAFWVHRVFTGGNTRRNNYLCFSTPKPKTKDKPLSVLWSSTPKKKKHQMSWSWSLLTMMSHMNHRWYPRCIVDIPCHYNHLQQSMFYHRDIRPHQSCSWHNLLSHLLQHSMTWRHFER